MMNIIHYSTFSDGSETENFETDCVQSIEKEKGIMSTTSY